MDIAITVRARAAPAAGHRTTPWNIILYVYCIYDNIRDTNAHQPSPEPRHDTSGTPHDTQLTHILYVSITSIQKQQLKTSTIKE